MRKECGTQLMKTVRMKHGTVIKPRKVFPYQSIQKALQNLIQRPGFLQCCEKWRTRKHFRESGYLCDIYDGLVWEEYKEFLSAPYNYLLTLNVDWFCPFEHGRYSVGAIYITIQNLPASIRNHPDNIILVGIIPGPSEPHLTLNSYLTPLISGCTALPNFTHSHRQNSQNNTHRDETDTDRGSSGTMMRNTVTRH